MQTLIEKLPEGWLLIYTEGLWTVLDDEGETVLKGATPRQVEDGLMIEVGLQQAFMAMHMAMSTTPAEA
tara:strand:- start:3601 stop:3807 length:207 start_codon:yes stop_codon:yes gene_type:complete